MGRRRKYYAIYRKDKLLGMGSILELADKLNVKPQTIKKFGTPSYIKSVEDQENRTILVDLGYYDEQEDLVAI